MDPQTPHKKAITILTSSLQRGQLHLSLSRFDSSPCRCVRGVNTSGPNTFWNTPASLGMLRDDVTIAHDCSNTKHGTARSE
jgi:hypothetical protein